MYADHERDVRCIHSMRAHPHAIAGHPESRIFRNYPLVSVWVKELYSGTYLDLFSGMSHHCKMGKSITTQRTNLLMSGGKYLMHTILEDITANRPTTIKHTHVLSCVSHVLPSLAAHRIPTLEGRFHSTMFQPTELMRLQGTFPRKQTLTF